MAESLYIELGPTAVERLERLMAAFGEDEPEAMVARALGLLEVIRPFLRERTTLTVVDPQRWDEGSDDIYVNLVFENASADDGSRKRAA